jgi:hypothetical protein
VSERTCFVLDSNVFIQAKNTYYSFDICPGFWDSLLWHHGDGNVCSIDRVKAELTKGRTGDFKKHKDRLADWAKTAAPPAAFCSTDREDVAHWYGETVKWVMASTQFHDAAKAEYADTERADAWLIAYAKATGCVVVTQEAYNPESKARVPIPNVCDAFGVAYLDSFQMLEILKTEYHWQPPVA